MLTLNELKSISSLRLKKFRENEGKFLIEGFHLIEECLKSEYIIESIIISEELVDAQKGKFIKHIVNKKIPVHYIKKNQFKKLSETENPQGIVAVVETRILPKPVFNSVSLFIALDKISDPGNLGTIIRTAYWFNADGILLSSKTVDMYNSKVIRATQGALFHVKVYENINLHNELLYFQSSGFKVFLFDVKSESEFERTAFGDKNILVFGNETEGISTEILSQPFEKVKIKGYSNCESLNVSSSCSIALHYLRTGK